MNEKEQLIDNMINKLIDTALAEVGYKEGPNNKNKYAAELDSINYYAPQKKQNVAWCSIFVTWCFYKTFGAKISRKMLFQPVIDNYAASCKFQYDYYKKNKATSTTPKKGYQIFFGKTCNHTGLVYKVDSKKVYTVEGNKADQVKKCSYNLDSTKIYGYGIPDYAAELQIVDTKPEKPEKPKEESYETTASWLNVRYEKSTKSPIVGCLKKGTIIKGTKEGEWIKIGMHKYIYAKYTRPEWDTDY